MLQPVSQVRADFDRLARLDEACWDHNTHYHPYLLAQLPQPCGEALEIGCGTGAFARELARRAERVLALDLSEQMIRVARERSAGIGNLEYRVEDVSRAALPPARFDCIASITTLHHLEAETTLRRIRDALRPGGVLLVLDLLAPEGPRDAARSLLAVPWNLWLRWRRNGRLRDPRALREAWAEHGRHDRYLRFSQLRALGAALLPGATLRRHLLWRYSLVWRKPRGGE